MEMDDIGTHLTGQRLVESTDAARVAEGIRSHGLRSPERARDWMRVDIPAVQSVLRQSVPLQAIGRGGEFDVDLVPTLREGLREVAHVDRVASEVVRRVEGRHHEES